MLAQRKGFRQVKNYDSDMKLDMLPQLMYEFINKTKKLCSQCDTETMTSSLISLKHSSSANTSATDETLNATERQVKPGLRHSL